MQLPVEQGVDMVSDAIARVLLGIVGVGLLRIRAAGYGGRPEECALEADHLHNLPQLLASLEPEGLNYYWAVERPEFVRRSSRVDDFAPFWEELGRLVEAYGARDPEK